MASPQTKDGFTRIANELLEALTKVPSIGSEAFQVLMCVIRRTYGWNLKATKISYGQIVTDTGLERRNAVRGMNRLVEKRLVFRVGEMTAINKNYETWIVSKRTLSASVGTDTTGGSEQTQKPVSDQTRLYKDRIDNLKTGDSAHSGLQSLGEIVENGGGYVERI